MAALQLLRTVTTRPPLTTIDSIRSVVEKENPRPYQTFPMRLCLLSADIFNQGRGIHADFVDEDVAQVFQEFQTEFDQAARPLRAHLIFRLTIWQPRNGQPLLLDQFPFTPSNVVNIAHVANLTTWKNMVQGTAELAHMTLATQARSTTQPTDATTTND